MKRGDQRLRVAVVDDSTFIRKAITRMLEDDGQIRVVGSAASGEELLTHLDEWRPDAVTLDLDMPGMGGLATLDRVMAVRPTPVIILSTHSGKGAPLTIEALHRGAVDFIDKQRYSLVDFGALRHVLLEKLFQVTGFSPPEVEPERRGATRAARQASATPPPAAPPAAQDFDVIVLGASTGGPPALQTLLEQMPADTSTPIVIVQHMPKGFTQAFAERLNAYLPLQVREAQHAEYLQPATVYIAIAGEHLRLRTHDDRLFTEVSPFPKNLVHAPSIDVLFESAARAAGKRVIACLLTGMGSDGAKGMAALKAVGAHTLCQDEKSSVVFGMPRSALALDAVNEVLDPEAMGARLRQLARGAAIPAGRPSSRIADF
ncbi:MAG: chemotaxis-specific protein-glutamate methyltransferase CheB [Acidobacteriota bacterium]